MNASMTPPSTDPFEGEGAVLTEQDAQDLLRIARALFPHRGLGDAPYRRAAEALATRASKEPMTLHVVADGLREMRDSARGPVDEDTLHRLLAEREDTPFFELMRSSIAWDLYDDREVWQYLGYPGPSFHLGGYLTRGFNDLDWLPEPRVEESPLDMVEIGPIAQAASQAQERTAS